MTSRVDTLIQWWKENDGNLVNLDRVWPFITVHAVPDPGQIKPKPLLIGTHSWQREVAQTLDPDVLTHTLVTCFTPDARPIIEAHRHASDTFEPVLTRHRLLGAVHHREFDTLYERLIIPVRTLRGARLTLTLSDPQTVH